MSPVTRNKSKSKSSRSNSPFSDAGRYLNLAPAHKVAQLNFETNIPSLVTESARNALDKVTQFSFETNIPSLVTESARNSSPHSKPFSYAETPVLVESIDAETDPLQRERSSSDSTQDGGKITQGKRGKKKLLKEIKTDNTLKRASRERPAAGKELRLNQKRATVSSTSTPSNPRRVGRAVARRRTADAAVKASTRGRTKLKNDKKESASSFKAPYQAPRSRPGSDEKPPIANRVRRRGLPLRRQRLAIDVNSGKSENTPIVRKTRRSSSLGLNHFAGLHKARASAGEMCEEQVKSGPQGKEVGTCVVLRCNNRCHPGQGLYCPHHKSAFFPHAQMRRCSLTGDQLQITSPVLSPGRLGEALTLSLSHALQIQEVRAHVCVCMYVYI